MPETPPPHPLDHLVSKGNVSGPRREYLWNRVAGQVVVAQRPWWMRLPAITVGLMSVGAVAGALLLLPVENPAFHARGLTPAPPILEASCGSAGAPCHVGQPISLRVLPGVSSGRVVVLLQTPHGPVVIDTLPASETEQSLLGNTVTPESGDVGKTLRVETFWVPQVMTSEQQAQWLTHPTGPHSALSLDVAP